MKRKQRSLFILIVVLAIFATGCTVEEKFEEKFGDLSETQTEVQATSLSTVPYFSDNHYTIKYVALNFQEPDCVKDAKRAGKKMQKKVNALLEDLCQYLNEEYDANWESGSIEVYTSNVIESASNVSIDYGAFYYDGCIYIDNTLMSNELKGQLKYIVAHELLHYLYNKNCFGPRFCVSKETKVTGGYLEEAMVDSLARRYILAKDPDINQDDLKSGYSAIRLYVDLLEMAVPDTFSYFFKNDINGLQEAVDTHSSEYVMCIGSAFEKWCSLLDETVTGNQEIKNDRASMILSFSAVITSSEKADEFISRTKDEGLDTEEFANVMY